MTEPDGIDTPWAEPDFCSDCQEAPCACPTVTDYEKALGRIAELEEDLADLQQNYELRAAELADAQARLVELADTSLRFQRENYELRATRSRAAAPQCRRGPKGQAR